MGDKVKMQTCNSEEKEVWIARFYIQSVRDDLEQWEMFNLKFYG